MTGLSAGGLSWRGEDYAWHGQGWPELVIETPRLRLRAPAAADVDAFAAELADFDIVRMLARVPWPYSRMDAVSFVTGARADAEGRHGLHLVVEDGNGLAGLVGLSFSPVSLFAPAPELGYWIARSRWGHGIATEAGRGVLAFAFEALGAKAVRSGAFHDNPASLAVQAKLGFEVVGRSHVFCLARGAEVAHIDTMLTRGRFREVGA